MAKKQITDLVKKLKLAGIKVSLTKPKSDYVPSLQQMKELSSPMN